MAPGLQGSHRSNVFQTPSAEGFTWVCSSLQALGCFRPESLGGAVRSLILSLRERIGLAEWRLSPIKWEHLSYSCRVASPPIRAGVTVSATAVWNSARAWPFPRQGDGGCHRYSCRLVSSSPTCQPVSSSTRADATFSTSGDWDLVRTAPCPPAGPCPIMAEATVSAIADWKLSV